MGLKSMSKSRAKTNRKFRKLNTREKTLAIVVLAALLVGAWLPERIIVSTSPSLQYRVFFLIKTKINKKVETGDYLVFRHKDTRFIHKGLDQENNRLVKKVGCSPGDVLTRDAVKKEYFCGQTSLGTALTIDSKGRTLPSFQFTGPIPEGSYFVVGSNPRSFDSKYFGFVHADEILYKALPLW